MSPKAPRTFHFHACAHAFSANFTRPFHHQIDIQAQSALPVIGGHGHSRVDSFEFRSFISFQNGYSHVSGGHQPDDDTHHALFHDLLTYEAAESAFKKGDDFRKIAEDPLGTDDVLKPANVDGVFLCSIVKSIKADCPGVKVHGHSLYVPGFGKVFLGELLIKH